MTTTIWAAAVAFANAIRGHYTSMPFERHRRRPLRECPAWCAGGHQCAARLAYPSGEHRTTPETHRTRYGSMTVTGVQTLAGVRRVDLRLNVAIPADATPEQAQLVPVAVDLAVRAVLASPSRRKVLAP